MIAPVLPAGGGSAFGGNDESVTTSLLYYKMDDFVNRGDDEHCSDDIKPEFLG